MATVTWEEFRLLQTFLYIHYGTLHPALLFSSDLQR